MISLVKITKKCKTFGYKNLQTTAVSTVVWEVIPFLGSSVHECGLAQISFSSREMKFSVVSQDLRSDRNTK